MPRYTVTVNEREFDITLDYHAEHLEVEVDGQKRRVVVHQLQDTRSLILIDNRSLEVDVRSNGEQASGSDRIVFMRGREIPVSVEDHALAQMRKAAGISTKAGGDKLFKAPMPGLVVETRVEPGQTVSSGEPLILIEAMKMENVLKSRTSGTVKAVPVEVGQSVEKGDTLVEFE